MADEIGKNAGIVLYCLDHPGRLYITLMHRLGCNKFKEAILYVNKNSKLQTISKKLVENKIFKEVYTIDLLMPRQYTENITEQKIVDYYREAFSVSPYNFEQFDEIVCSNDTGDGHINLYFNIIKQRYTWLELAINRANIRSLRMSDAMTNFSAKYKFLTAYAEYAHPCLFKNSNESQTKLAYKDFTTWDDKECLARLSEEELDVLAECYDFDVVKLKENGLADSGLIVENSYGWSLRDYVEINFKSKYSQILNGYDNSLESYKTPYIKLASIMDRVAVDFYLPNYKNFYVKNHPHEPNLTEDLLKDNYGDAFLPFPDMPFELVGQLFKSKDIKLGTLLTYAHGMDTFDCHQIILGQNYFYTWFMYCSIYVSILYSKFCGFTNVFCSEKLMGQIELLSNQIGYEANVQVIDINNLSIIKNLRNSIIISNYIDDWAKNLNTVFSSIHQSNAICFIGVELTEKFFDEKYFSYFASIVIEKEKISRYTFNLQKTENIWVYSADKKYRDLALEFSCSKELVQSGYIMKVNQNDIAASVNLYKYESMCQKVKNQQRELDRVTSVINALLAQNLSLTCELLKKEIDIYWYFQRLNMIKDNDNLLIVCSIKDTPGNTLNSVVIDTIKKVGFTKFSKELWRMYIGIIYKGKAVCDLTGEKREDPVSFAVNDVFCGIDLKVNSMAWRQGNKAEIIINGTDYAVNMRGINIVIYDVENNKLLDSVAFDYHTENKVCKHKN